MTRHQLTSEEALTGVSPEEAEGEGAAGAGGEEEETPLFDFVLCVGNFSSRDEDIFAKLHQSEGSEAEEVEEAEAVGSGEGGEAGGGGEEEEEEGGLLADGGPHSEAAARLHGVYSQREAVNRRPARRGARKTLHRLEQRRRGRARRRRCR